MREGSTHASERGDARRDAICARAMRSRAMLPSAAAIHGANVRLSERIQMVSCCKNNFAEVTIFLDTEFHQNYTFVSCMLRSCSIVVLSIGRIDTWQPRKQPRKSSRRQPRSQPRRSNPTQRQTQNGGRDERPPFCVDALPAGAKTAPALPIARSWAWRDSRRPCSCRCC
jgi:hypothetical protein